MLITYTNMQFGKQLNPLKFLTPETTSKDLHYSNVTSVNIITYITNEEYLSFRLTDLLTRASQDGFD